MAQRRMLSKRIINSAKFLRMPASSQALYFHLVLGADDDGIVESFGIMRQVAASDDDLQILVAKNFIIILNEDLVSYITDWHENNKIRADRKIDSIYQELLLSKVPDAQIQKSRPRADAKSVIADVAEKQEPKSMDVHRTAEVREVEINLDKDNSIQSNLVENREDSSASSNAFKVIQKIYQENFGQVTNLIEEQLHADLKKYGLVLIREAMKRSKLANANYRYAQGILKDWDKQNIKSIEDIIDADQLFKSTKNRKITVRETIPTSWNQPTSIDPQKAAVDRKKIKKKLEKLRQRG
ncbi:DnaD domain-containing protein [Pediococcus stilesii]|uniref:DnaB/C C-terminal domain-containing protein n=1 Tax=Pediococcus stilesii TaxID=331679 RepID=A0A0R2L073_9LACO|nr:DnaD domain protein [Pediococcus stilesii]KRN95192.1 hypothetical protein IV81_GL000074 [Pediococcus stilesii]